MVMMTSKHRHAVRGFVAILFVGALLAGAGCSSPSEGSREPQANGTPTTAPITTKAPAGTTTVAAGTGTQLSKINACDLVTRDEVTAALGAPIGKSARTGTSDTIVSCVFEAATNNSAVTLTVERPDEGAKTLMEYSRAPDARPIAVALGDDAFVTSPSVKANGEVLRSDVVWVLKDDLVLTVNEDLPHGTGVKTRDPSTYDGRLAKLAGQALARLPW